jgi:citrate lyase subunit beta/citryl-CoA lyase
VTASATVLPPRSWLFVPGDSERKQTRALAGAADALILDLEDSVEPSQLPAARARVAGLLDAAGGGGEGPQLWVRVNSLASGLLAADLTAVRHAHASGGEAAGRSAPLRRSSGGPASGLLEAHHGMRAGTTRLLVLTTETPLGLLNLPGYPAVPARPRRRWHA